MSRRMLGIAASARVAVSLLAGCAGSSNLTATELTAGTSPASSGSLEVGEGSDTYVFALGLLRESADEKNTLVSPLSVLSALAMAENGVLKVGKVTDFQAHMIQHQYGAYTHTNHGMGLAVIHPALYRHLAASAPAQFGRWAREVWGVVEKDDLAAAMAGIDALAAFTAEMGLPTTFSELGGDASDETLRAVADTCLLTPGCAKQLSRDEIFQILTECRWDGPSRRDRPVAASFQSACGVGTVWPPVTFGICIRPEYVRPPVVLSGGIVRNPHVHELGAAPGRFFSSKCPKPAYENPRAVGKRSGNVS